MLLGPTTQGWYLFELLKFHDFPGLKIEITNSRLSWFSMTRKNPATSAMPLMLLCFF